MLCLGSLYVGDIYIYCFYGWLSIIIDLLNRKIYYEVYDVCKWGVFFDLGYGCGLFLWIVVEICVKEGFWFDVISFDLYVECVDGLVYDLLIVMMKMLYVGMFLIDVIKVVIMILVVVIGWSDVIGFLSYGCVVDIIILCIENVDIDFEDCYV